MTVHLNGYALYSQSAGHQIDRLPAEPDAFAPPQSSAASKRDDRTVPLGKLV